MSSLCCFHLWYLCLLVLLLCMSLKLWLHTWMCILFYGVSEYDLKYMALWIHVWCYALVYGLIGLHMCMVLGIQTALHHVASCAHVWHYACFYGVNNVWCMTLCIDLWCYTVLIHTFDIKHLCMAFLYGVMHSISLHLCNSHGVGP